MKTCTKCKETKPLVDFSANKHQKDGLQSYCRSCGSKASSLYHQKNKEKTIEVQKRYYEKNKDQRIKAAAEWRKNNIERFRSGQSRRNHNRRLIINSDKEFYLREEIFERDNWICQVCYLEVDRNITYQYDPGFSTIDHIIPLTKGGSDRIDNVQLAHSRCNIQKSNKIDLFRSL